MADVFISYHRSDGASALARRIAGELESRGVTCWYDTKNTAPVDFVERIVTEIESCKVFLFIWDEKANEDSKKRNSYVRSEIQCAYGEKRIALFPFQVGKFEQNKTLKFYFAHINIPYGGDTPETAQIEELVNAIADILGKTQPPPAKIIKSDNSPMTWGEAFGLSEPQTSSAKIIKSGKCGDNVNCTLDENGVLTLSGSGAMWDFTWNMPSAPPWWKVREKISHIEILNGVTNIGKKAFWGCKNLTSVNISDSVARIEKWAFDDCAKLKSVSVPAKTKIISDAFSPYIRITRREQADNQ
ncbi:MAG: leucine-rich repeat protein [Oscillospiraceae bacterium]|nr:leucine-rich repeat protein [Oscillospiraceae bacterium]